MREVKDTQVGGMADNWHGSLDGRNVTLSKGPSSFPRLTACLFHMGVQDTPPCFGRTAFERALPCAQDL